MKFGGFDWDSGNLPKCLGHGVSLAEIEGLFACDVYLVRDTIVSGERRILGFGDVCSLRVGSQATAGFDPATANGIAQISIFAKETRLISTRHHSV